ncbi:type VII secretion protein EsaA [Priestia flexa]|uniref:type VII secretion protein EsaA n=1 Tax=Priestia TaxID=2800373 RepID=UPI00220446BD|nr:type VII secretion protein EsaA [Priestia flexa]MDT2048470.1 type VII secretion protein EsaA [Priestia flexa]USY55462.1 type VII secretion protein EsaA [Bacillus sp. 1780r2a1]
MTEQRKYMLKVIVAVIFILGFPSLFFQYIGDNPLKVTENATRAIAVVNEDIGVEEEKGEEPIRFGQRVAAILDKDSDYDWTVLSRSAAANGLQSGKYDAVIYIPSNFSENILTYDQEKPKKATFQYKVQNQLNAVNKEKVVRELEDATAKVNNDMSSLYWSYVSQEVEKVRGQFDKILEKEIAFQNTMVAFYKPNSKNLAGEIDDQKKILEQIQTNVKSAQEGSSERKNDVQQVEENLTNFIEYVEEYKVYQEKQKEMLLKAQTESVGDIQEGIATISEGQNGDREQFESEAGKVFGKLSTVQQQIDENKEMVDNLQEATEDKTSGQQDELNRLNQDLLSQYSQVTEQTTLNEVQSKLSTLRKDLEIPPSKGEEGETLPPIEDNPVVPEDEEGEAPPEDSEDSYTTVPVDLENQRQQLQGIKDDLQAWNENLAALPEEEQNERVADTQQKIADFSTRLQGVSDQLENVTVEVPKADNDNNGKEELQKQIKELLAVNEALRERVAQLEEINNQPNGDVQTVVSMITNKEAKILSSSQLSESRKQRLAELFAPGIQTENMSKLFQYYGDLSQYELALNRGNNGDLQDAVLQDEGTRQRIQAILYGDEQPSVIRKQLQNNLLSTAEGLDSFSSSMQEFTDSYGQLIEREQASIVESLSALQEKAGSMNETVQSVASESAVEAPTQENADVSSLVTLQKSMGQELKGMNDLISTLGERQSSVVEYTGELQEKVNEVQDQADTLNNKWSQNVDSTKLVRGQVYRLLNNTLVDGQNNDYVYDYLANPLQVSGEVPAEKTKTVPPVVLLVIILISSLLIGYFSHYYKNAPLLVRGSLFGLLVMIVGLMISTFSLNIYSLSGERAMEWSIFTIVLLLLASTLVRGAFLIGNFVGWIITVLMILFFITPLLNLAMPNFNYEDPASKVYMSIQYETTSLFAEATIILLGLTAVLTVIPFIIRMLTSKDKQAESDETYEA